MSQAGVADAPYSFEERLIPYEKANFKRLRVLIPEIHGFILMKSVRGYEHNLDVIEEISKK
jgi:dihydropteroate synthase